MTDEDALALVGLLLATSYKKNKKRDKWVKEWLRKRKTYSHINLLAELKFEPKDYFNYMRMDEKTYLKLLALVTPLIKKKDTVLRNAISPHERLAITLRFLATGRSYECLKFSSIISPQALCKIIPETCQAIYEVLHKDYLKFPKTDQDWKNIANNFEHKWNFPHCLGAIDGKHIEIVPPHDSGSQYYNYKGRFSMVLMAIVDANYQFIMCDFGTNGRVSDGGVLQNTLFYEKLNAKLLHIPPAENIRNCTRSMPYVFVADDAFPLREDMIKPFRQADLNSREKKIYNYRVSRARRIVENAFGILASRFRIFHTQINVQPESIENIVMATCALHNFLIRELPNNYAQKECFDRGNREEGTITPGYNSRNSNMEELERRNPGNTLNAAKRVREDFVQYFVNEGQVSWQDNYIS